MFAARQLAALFAIAAGGFINAGIVPDVPPEPGGEQSFAATSEAPADSVLQRAAEHALLAQLRSDLGDAAIALRLSGLRFQRASGRSVEGRGIAIANFDGSGPVVLDVSVAYDLPTKRVEQASYLIAGAAPTLQLDAATRQRIADRIGSRLVLEFAGQPVDFALRRVAHLAAGRDKLLVSGEGLASFAGEGAAITRFVATADRGSGRLLTLQYELGEQVTQQAFRRH